MRVWARPLLGTFLLADQEKSTAPAVREPQVAFKYIAEGDTKPNAIPDLTYRKY
jgi:hypothetical protein